MRVYDDNLKSYIAKHFSLVNGVITRDDRKNSNGSLDAFGYLVLKIKGVQIKAHRVAWFLHYGEFPEGEIDHINRDKLDNRIENLRIATRQQQNLNKDRTPNPDTGFVGIYMDKSTKGLRAKYCFHISGKSYRFRTLQEAAKQKREMLAKIWEAQNVRT